VWAFEQGEEESVSKRKFECQDCFVPWHLGFKYEKDLEGIDQTDAVVDMEKKAVVYKRYYHVFVERELEALVKECQGLEVVESYYDKDNWAVRVRKVA
jgi:alkylated DNA repair protein alkB family protein 8